MVKISLRTIQILSLITVIIFWYYSKQRMGFMRFTYFINNEIETYLNITSIKFLLSLSVILIIYKFILKSKESLKVGYLGDILIGVVALLFLFKSIFLGDKLHGIVTITSIIYLYIEVCISINSEKLIDKNIKYDTIKYKIR